MPLVVSLSVAPVAADQINYSSLAALEATGIGPRIAHREQTRFPDGRYEDGSVATGALSGAFPEWFSSVYFNGTLYTYAYGVSELICGNCDSDYISFGEARMLGGELVGASLGDRWGEINEPYGLEDDFAFFVPLTQTARGFTFFSPEVAWFYLQTERAPADMFGLLSATSSMHDGSGEGKPLLVYTMSMDAFVPVPEPGTFVLVSTCLAGALIRRRHQKQKGTIT
ncbi:MAG: PEP-CTERM sorting domain-containing protein [Vicinamibacterales bacterium]